MSVRQMSTPQSYTRVVNLNVSKKPLVLYRMTALEDIVNLCRTVAKQLNTPPEKLRPLGFFLDIQKRHAAKQLENQTQFFAGRQQLVDALALEQSAIIDILNRKNGSRSDGGEGSADGGVGGDNGGSAVVLSTAEQEAHLDHARSKVADYESQVSSTEQKDQLDAAQAAETAKQLGKARTICIEWQGHNLPPKVSDALTQILAMQALNRGGGSGGVAGGGVTESIKRKREADVGVLVGGGGGSAAKR